MSKSISKNRIERRLWLIWSLLPVPLANPLILPVGLVLAYYAILPSFIGLHFTHETLTFPSPEQINAYGLKFYKSLLSKSLLALVISTVSWITGLAAVFLTARNIKKELQEAKDESKSIKIGIVLTILSILSGTFLVLSVGIIG